MSVSSMLLNGDWLPDEWPDGIIVGHKGETDGKTYVPERTCRDTDYDTESVTCSECGEITLNTLYRVELGDGLMTVNGHRPRFCSNCGARVIGEETGNAD